MSLFKVGDLLNMGVTGAGNYLLVMPVVRVTKTMAICCVGTRIERVNNSRGNRLGFGVFIKVSIWDGREDKHLRYPEVKGIC